MEEKKTRLERRKTEVEKEEKGMKGEEIGREDERKEERKKRKLSSRGNSRDSTPVKRSKISSLGSSSSQGETSIIYIYFIFLKRCRNLKHMFNFFFLFKKYIPG
jgi:hypothetical protein